MIERLPVSIDLKLLLKTTSDTDGRKQEPAQTPIPRRITSSEFLTLKEKHKFLINSAKTYFQSYFSRGSDVKIAVVLCDPSAVVLSTVGHPEVLRTLFTQGIHQGLVVEQENVGNNVLDLSLRTRQTAKLLADEHQMSYWSPWHWFGCPIITDTHELLGVCAVAVSSPEMLNTLQGFMEGAAVALAQLTTLELNRQGLSKLHDTLISHLHHHIYFLDNRSGRLKVYHPNPVTPSLEKEMRQLVTTVNCLHQDRRLEDSIYAVDIDTLTNEQGEIQGVLGIFLDISQQKAWESQIQNMERMATLNSLAAGIAHEIRNPLTSARGFLQLLSERTQSEEESRFLDLILDELDRVTALVRDFMSLAKPEPPARKATDLVQLVREVTQFIQPEAALYGIPFETTVPTGAISIWGDAKQLKQVLLNIVQNALQACYQERGTVHISVQEAQSRAIIRIQDTGPGMDVEQQQRIFLPFHTTKANGTGLGLAISRKIVEDHGGTITVDSSPGVGTTMTIVLATLKNAEVKAFQSAVSRAPL